MATHWVWDCHLEVMKFTNLQILLDTNFLLIPAQFKVDIFQEIDRLITQKYDLITLPDIINELTEFGKKSKKNQSEARIALELAKKCKIIETNSEIPLMSSKRVDDIILQLAVKYRWIVATNDAALRKKLRSVQLPTITLRNKAYLIIEGDIASS
jgi:rRNA-processing protein FCF1